MREGWCGEDHLIIFAESEVDHLSERYAMSALLPGYRILGLRGWDDFIVQDVDGRSYSIPTVPLDFQYLFPFNIPPNVNLVKNERFDGKIKWYVKPIAFGGDPKAEDNVQQANHNPSMRRFIAI
jgi:hypothetical protein